MPPQKHSGSLPDRDNDNGIRPWKMIRHASSAMSTIACILNLSLCPAICAKPVAFVPMKQGAGLRQNGEFSLRQHPRHCKAAQICEAFFRLRSTGKPAMAIFIDPQKNHFG